MLTPEPGGDDEDSVRSVTNSEQSEEEKAKWSKKDCVHSQSHIVLQHAIVPMFLPPPMQGGGHKYLLVVCSTLK